GSRYDRIDIFLYLRVVRFFVFVNIPQGREAPNKQNDTAASGDPGSNGGNDLVGIMTFGSGFHLKDFLIRFAIDNIETGLQSGRKRTQTVSAEPVCPRPANL